MSAEYKFLRKLLGEAWVEKEILGSEPKHALGLWQRKDAQNIVVPHVDRLLESLFTQSSFTFNSERLAQKLKAEFGPTLAELEWAVWLAERGFAITVEPLAPNVGPDLEARKDQTYFLEIRTMRPAEQDARFSLACTDAFSRLKKIPSSYQVILSMEGGYSAYSRPLKQAVAAVSHALSTLKASRPERATLYYFSPGEHILNIGGDIEWGPVDYSNPKDLVEKVKRYEYVRRAGFIARFFDLGEERETTIVGANRVSPSIDDSHERFRRILGRKRTQLPRDKRGIIVLDVSDLVLGEESVFSALYGDMQMQFSASPDGTVSDPEWKRAPNGFFRNTSRVSVVVVYRRGFSEDWAAIQTSRHVFPTNRAHADTIQLTLQQLEYFGEVPADVRLLSAVPT
jgi:hypothetical protein